MKSQDSILIVTSEEAVREIGPTELKVDVLAENVNLFLTQLGGVLDQAPETVNKFQFAEFEVYAEVSGEGQLVLLGTGVKAGASGGIKFVFKKTTVPTFEI